MLKKNVLIVCPFFRPNIGGVETHLDDLCEYLRIHDYKVFVVTYQPLTTKTKGLRLEKKENLEIYRINWFGYGLFHKLESYPILEFLYITPRLLFGVLLFLLRNNQKIDIIHAHGLNAAFIAKVLFRIFKKKCIVSLHAIYGLNQRSIKSKMIRWTLKSADKILTLSKPSKDELFRIGIPLEKIDIYKHWVKQDIFKPLDKLKIKECFNLQQKFVVLFVGRFIEKKGISLLIEVAKQVNKKIHFLFIGDGPFVNVVKKSCREINNISFIGKLNNQDLPIYYNVADVVCIPSQYEEGSGRVILESISSGTPVIASNRGGIPELVDKTVGILVESTADSLKAAIEDLYYNREKLKIFNKNCRVYAEKNFGEKNATIFLDSYEK